MSKAAITSLALLKVQWDRHQRSYTDNFVPLVAECIRKSKSPVVVVGDLQKEMLTEFGLRVPANALKVILERAKKQGYLSLENKVYRPNHQLLQKLSIDDTRQDVLERHAATVASLIEFCKTSYNVDWKQVEAENALLAYLKDYDLDILSATTEGTALPAIISKPSNATFLVNAFVLEIEDRNPTAFSYFETIVKGHILAGVLSYPDVSLISSKFRKTRVYLDTRVILNAMGYGGLPQQNACRDLLQLLYEEGAELRCFRHTFEEIYGILDACSKSFRSKSTIEFPAGLTLVFQGCTESDVLLAMATLERDIRRLRIEIDDKPTYSPEHQISESDLDKHLQKSIGYGNERARIRDVDSLSAIYRLRKGYEFSQLELSRAFFVTTNIKLVHAASDFFQSYQTSRSSAPICISDHHLTNILWLKRPALVSDLPKKRIIADAYAALEPSAELWRKFLAEVEKLKARGNINPEEYIILRNSIEVRSTLMDTTLGDPEAVIEGTVTEVLEAYNKNLKAEAEAKLGKAEEKTAELRSQLDSVSQRIDLVAEKCSVVISRAILVLLFAVLLIGAYTSYRAPQLHSWAKFSLSAASIILLLYGVMDLCFGISVQVTVRRAERFTRHALSHQMERLFLRR